MSHFIITHQNIPWKIPFKHTVIGIGGYEPVDGIAAKNLIGEELDNEHALGGIRSARSIIEAVSKVDSKETIKCSTYRLFISNDLNEKWNLSVPFSERHRIVSPEDFHLSHEELVLQLMPPGVDLVICTPIHFPCTVLEQYTVHHLDDLLFAMGCAVRAGLIDQTITAKILSGNIMLPFGFYASKPQFRVEFTEKILYCVREFMLKHWIPRTDYQRRCIDFAFERVASVALYQSIIRDKLNVLSSTPVLISDSETYNKSV
jgi:hypothetical protein